MIQANGIEICTEAFGEPNDVPILLVMGARVAVLDAYDIESAHAVGPSLGGLTVQHLALDHRSRVRTITPIMSLPDTSPALLRGYEKQWSE